ncbi:tyrosine-type recombinase/integrase [Pseudoroseicyclus sp. H15]
MGSQIRNGIVSLTGIKTVRKKGKTYLYFQRRGQPLIRLPDLPMDDPVFLRAYAEAKSRSPEPPAVAAGSIAALVRAALSSDRYRSFRPATKEMMRRHLDEVRREHGALPARGLRSRHIARDVADANVPGHRLRAWRFMCSWAADPGVGLLARNEALDVAMPKSAPSDGHVPWSRDDVALFRARWPIGSTSRAIFEVLHWTGARISDAVMIGPGMVDRSGVLSFRQVKTGGDAHVPWTCPLPRYALHLAGDRQLMLAAIAPLSGHMTFLPTKQGTRRSHKAIGGDVRAAAKEAGISKTAHGLRKTRSIELAEGGATATQIMAWTGHMSLREAERYTRGADRRRAVIGKEQDQPPVKSNG